MNLQSVTLTGERAALVPMALDYAPGLYESGNDPDVWRYMPVWRMERVEDAQTLIREMLQGQAAGTALPFTIFDRDTGRIVGSTQLFDISVPHRQGEIGWTWLTPTAQRTRINTECKYLLLCHAFETLGMIRVQLKTDARNERSQRAMERIGAVREGVLRRHRILPDGFVRDFGLLQRHRGRMAADKGAFGTAAGTLMGGTGRKKGAGQLWGRVRVSAPCPGCVRW